MTPRSSFEVPSLRWMRKVKCFSTYFIEVLEEARQSRGGLTGLPRPGGRLARELPSTEHSTLGGSVISKKKAPTREISRGKSRSWRKRPRMGRRYLYLIRQQRKSGKR